MERAQTEVKAGRKYIDGLEESLKSKQAVIDAQTKRQTLSDEALASRTKEVEILRAAIVEQKNTIAIQEAEIKFVKSELAKVNKKLKRSRKLNQILIATAVGAILASILK